MKKEVNYKREVDYCIDIYCLIGLRCSYRVCIYIYCIFFLVIICSFLISNCFCNLD